MNQHLLNTALSMLRCPHCHRENTLVNSEPDEQLLCGHCHSRYSYGQGYLDFLPDIQSGVQSGFHLDKESTTGLAQKAMESQRIVSIYEDVFRPLFTALGSPIKYQQELDFLQRYKSVEPVNALLDLAAGTGRYTRLLADMYQPGVVFAVDISVPMLKANVQKCRKEGYDNVLAIRGDAGQLPLAEGIVDYVNCFGALHLFPEPQQAINELARVMPPGGIFTCLTAVEMESLPRRILQATFSRLAGFRFFNRTELQGALMAAGMSEQGAERKQMLLMFSARKHFA